MDFYTVLGVRRAASAAEIQRAYKRLARALHPDLNPGDPVAAEQYGAIARAFEVLGNPERRARYDRGEAAVASEPVPRVGFEGFDFSRGGGEVSFGEIFEAPREERSMARGEDLEQAAHVSFDESMQGAERSLEVVRFEACAACGGLGEVELAPVPCRRCRGTGSLRARRGHLVFSRACPDCAGRGRVSRRPCGDCAAEGRVLQTERIHVQIPPGVRPGERLRIPGGGNAGRHGGPPGDFVLVVEVGPHELFRRDGDDLHCVVPLSMVEAAGGAHVDVPTPDGPVVIEVPAGTQAGQRFRLRKRGAPRPEGGRGDLFVEVAIEIPTVVDDRGRALLRELAALHPQEPRRAFARKER
ncbi:MAG: J domain-containing protein [Vicinamibacteria bacterium]|nr:J domain-containing protein [Vicinamibacteria bacterium]